MVDDLSRVHIVTGSLEALAEAMSKDLGWGKTIGTQPEVKGNRLTGQLAGLAVKGSVKVVEVKRYFEMSDDDFNTCAAAGDSYGDRFLLEQCSSRFFPQKASKRLIRYFQ